MEYAESGVSNHADENSLKVFTISDEKAKRGGKLISKIDTLVCIQATVKTFLKERSDFQEKVLVNSELGLLRTNDEGDDFISKLTVKADGFRGRICRLRGTNYLL